MTITVSDPALLAALMQAAGTVTLTHPDGRELGAYTPQSAYPYRLPPGVKSPFSDEQLRELREQRTGRPLADIIRDLDAGGCSLAVL